MKPLAILTSDDNPDYLFCLPIVAKTWELQGFEPFMVVISNDAEPIRELFTKYGFNKLLAWPDVLSVKSELNPCLYPQCLRLYLGRNRIDSQYVVIGDADMLIASNFLYRDFDKVNVFGHDLTDFNEIPMCYVGCTADKWGKIFKDRIDKDIIKYSKYDSTVWHEAWGSDQQILTAKLKEYGFDRINFINRGLDSSNQNLPSGRWDRYGNFKLPAGQIDDVHLMRKPYLPKNVEKVQSILHHIYPNQYWGWVSELAYDLINTFNLDTNT